MDIEFFNLGRTESELATTTAELKVKLYNIVK